MSRSVYVLCVRWIILLYDYELAKLAVSPKVQGKGIGVLLCEAVVNKAKELGGKRIFIESNTRLKPAILFIISWASRNFPNITRLMKEETYRWN